MSIVDLLKQLITFRTVTDDQLENGRALTWVKKQVAHLPVAVHEKTINGFPSLLITTQQTLTPKLWLVAHMDVVPGSDDVFLPREKNDAITGRGAFDMKFAIACYIHLLQELGSDIPSFDFGVMLTCDEETGGQFGVKTLLEEGALSQVALIPDGADNWNIESSAKGIWQLALEVRGKAAHSSRPWEGQSASAQLINVLHEIKDLFIDEPCADPRHRHATCNIGVLTGGQAVNQIPDIASALLDIRFMDEAEQRLLAQCIEKLVTAVPGAKVTTLELEPSFTVSTQNEVIQHYQELVAAKVGTTPQFILSHGTSDARFFARHNVPCLITRPRGGGQHSEAEWINRTDLEHFYSVIKEIVIQNTRSSELPAR